MANHNLLEASRLETDRNDPASLVASRSVDNNATFGYGNEGAQLGQIYAQNNTINIGRSWQRETVDDTRDDDFFLFSLAFEEMDLRERQIKNRTPETCTWLLENTEYQKWLLNRGLLWITGKPGSGKSTILKFAINQGNRVPKERRENIVTASFFFDARGAPLQKTALGFYRSLLHQFYQQKREILHNFVSDILRSRGTKLLNQSLRKDELRLQLRNFILDVLDSSALTLYIDALDECAEDARNEVRQFIIDIVYESKTKPHLLGVCISCRFYPILIEKWDYCICVDINNSGDIERCIHYHFENTNMRKGHQKSLEGNMISRASGVFQWVDLVLPQVIEMNRGGKGIKQMLIKIEKTPQELDTLYTRMLDDISVDELQSSWSLLRWVCFAARPLSLDELRFATVFSAQLPYQSIQEYVENEDVCEDADQMERRMKTLSKGLIEVKSVNRQGDQLVAQFIHQSVNDFMQRSGLNHLYRRMTNMNAE